MRITRVLGLAGAIENGVVSFTSTEADAWVRSVYFLFTNAGGGAAQPTLSIVFGGKDIARVASQGTSGTGSPTAGVFFGEGIEPSPTDETTGILVAIRLGDPMLNIQIPLPAGGLYIPRGAVCKFWCEGGTTNDTLTDPFAVVEYAHG